ncbi:hypothetical protein AB1Y20_023445 [Prymnesium parvum]|uniref:Uncharacterized protein n=1 Tax=Prymnesium parvum TaxID=97485 RepID=A0AB34JDT9_PRYPA
MLYADKENLKTRVAQELLSVREKEMTFYAKNLSMVGTHAALLAGFAFTILSQYKFKSPDGGVISRSTREFLGMTVSCESTRFYDESSGDGYGTCNQLGIAGWAWDTWFIQIFQGLHLALTTLGMTVQLWTVYTCVFTNILGLHLALRGPEGSVDRAVRHMAQQNRMVLKKFTAGLVLFLLSVIFFSLSEYYFYVSFVIVGLVITISWHIYKNIRFLVNVFFVEKEHTVTGQFTDRGDSRARHSRLAQRDRRDTEYAAKGEVGVMQMGDMLAGKYYSKGKPRLREAVSIYLGGLRARMGLRKRKMKGGKGARSPSRGTRWAALHSWAAQSSLLGEKDFEEAQAPSRVAEVLIQRQQAASPGSSTGQRRRAAAAKLQAASRGFITRQRESRRTDGSDQPNSFGMNLPPFLDALVRSFGLNDASTYEQSVVKLQAGVRGRIARTRSREQLSARNSAMSDSAISDNDERSVYSEYTASRPTTPRGPPRIDCQNLLQQERVIQHCEQFNIPCDPRRSGQPSVSRTSVAPFDITQFRVPWDSQPRFSRDPSPALSVNKRVSFPEDHSELSQGSRSEARRNPTFALSDINSESDAMPRPLLRPSTSRETVRKDATRLDGGAGTGYPF